MEKDNKYYEIIENLVKNHKKYNGYDAIADDIIDDVYKHAKSVISSVKDEDVIMSYLQKLTSVSIITVPKKLNFHSELKHKVISSKVQEIIQTDVQKQEIPATESIQNFDTEITDNVQKANVEFVDKMINSIDTASITDIPAENFADSDVIDDESAGETELNEQDDIEPIEPLTEDIVTKETDVLEVDTEDILPENNFETEDSQEELISDEETEVIESVAKDTFNEVCQEELNTINKENTEEDVEILELADDDTTDEDSLDVIDETEEDNIAEDSSEDIDALIETDFLSDEDNNVELNEDITENNFAENEEIFADENETEEVFELSHDDSFNDSEVLKIIDDDENKFEISDNAEGDIGLVSVDSEINEESNFSELQELGTEQDLSFLATEDEESFNITDDSEMEFFERVDSDNSQEQAEKEHVFKPVDYSMFDYVPEYNNSSIDIQDIELRLAELNNQKPELNIFTIFDLKYKQNLSIPEIAEKLQMEKQDVITALDEIVELI